jgi:hypothetical protein
MILTYTLKNKKFKYWIDKELNGYEATDEPKMARVFTIGYRHPRESGGPGQPLQPLGPWIPAFAGTTNNY